MGVYVAGQEYTGLYIEGVEYTRLLSGGETYVEPAAAMPRHTFTVNAGSQQGYNRPSGNGSISGDGGTYIIPDGTSVNIWHCRPAGGGINFSLSGTVAVAQFPARIVASSSGNTVTLARGATARGISGGRATRVDYTATAGTIGDVFANGRTIVVQLWDV